MTVFAVKQGCFAQIDFGDCREIMRGYSAGSVSCCVTSPPYYGLRDYGHPGQLGLETTPDLYVAAMVGVFREAWRVLRDDGTLWLNLGDSYGAGTTATRQASKTSTKLSAGHHEAQGARHGGAAKQLLGIPWRVAFALQADGWYLRTEVIWNKTNPMPESVNDRPTRAHEYIFLLSKSKQYYYDHEAVKEPAVSTDARKFTDNGKDKQRGHGRRHSGFNGRYADRIATEGAPETRNRRSVWTVATRPYSGAHFATFPPALIEPCVLAGCPPGGIVLDPFMGSGTTAMVALQHGRNALGCDINEGNAPLIEERLA